MQKKKIEAKNGLENYAYSLRNSINDEKLKDKIDAAKEAWRAGDWAHGRFSLPPGDDAEFIPLP